MPFIEAIPAYGRDYTAATHVRKDWDAGKDFQVAISGQYINKADAAREGTKVQVYFDKERKSVVL